jgi:hypothetical protein
VPVSKGYRLCSHIISQRFERDKYESLADPARTPLRLSQGFDGDRWHLLFMQSVHDPVVFGNVAAVLIVVTVTASWIPAMRAARPILTPRCRPTERTDR